MGMSSCWGTAIPEESSPGRTEIPNMHPMRRVRSPPVCRSGTRSRDWLLTMWGNIGFLVKAIGTAVFFAILLIAANTMMMAGRERISENAVLKTLGFQDGLLFRLVLAEVNTAN